MIRYGMASSIVVLLVISCGVNPVVAQPEAVPRLTVRSLDQASYVKLAAEWKAYIEENGETPDALVNLGMAYRYTGEGDAALAAGRRAVEIAPDHAEALRFLGSMVAIYEQDMETAAELLERCRRLAPDYEYGLTTLASVYVKQGELAKSEEVFRTLFERRLIARPLQDYAYNMLVGLPQGAVLITNGDSDTFPPLALQAGMGFRDDVIVINRHLLNLEGYVNALFERHPAIKPEGPIKPDKNGFLSGPMLEKIVDEQKAPIYFALSVPIPDLGFEPELTLEGLNLRSSASGLSPEESARLFLDTYRMDSATDWSFEWSLVPVVSSLLSNYVGAMIRLSQNEMDTGTKQRLLERALDIATFHDMERLSYIVRSMQTK